MLVEYIRRRLTARHGFAIDGVTDGALGGSPASPGPATSASSRRCSRKRCSSEVAARSARGIWRCRSLRARAWRASGGPRPPPSGAGAADTRRRLALELAATDRGVSTRRLARAAGVGLRPRAARAGGTGGGRCAPPDGRGPCGAVRPAMVNEASVGTGRGAARGGAVAWPAGWCVARSKLRCAAAMLKGESPTGDRRSREEGDTAAADERLVTAGCQERCRRPRSR